MPSPQDISDRRLWQVAGLLWMIFFGASVFIGYYLIVSDSRFLGILFGLFMASLAIVIAKMIGRSGKSFRNPFFIFLVLISAVGVASGAFLNFEGKQIVSDAVVGSQDAVGRLDTEAQRRYSQLGVPKKLARVANLKRLLANEIRNPANCGQGRVASAYIAELEQLIDFKPVSIPRNNCSNNEGIIKTYNEAIDELTERATWNNRSLRDVSDRADALRDKLQAARQRAETSGPDVLIRSVRPELNKLDDEYRDLVNMLRRNGGNVDAVAPQLPLGPVEALGSSVNLVSLILSRMDRPSTWVYILVAFFLDWLTCQMFGELAKRRAPTGMVSVRPGAPGPVWGN